MKRIITIVLVSLYSLYAFADSPPPPNPNPNLNLINLKPVEKPYKVHAVITSEASATISSPMSGLITNLLIRDGVHFKKDEILIKFDCRVQLAELQKATAAVQLGEVNSASYARLANLGSASKMKVAESQAELEKAKADQKIAQKQVSDCEIKAPYDGQITELFVHQNETVQLYQKLFNILDNSALAVKVFVPSDWMSWLKVGSTFQLNIGETRQTYNVKVERIVTEVDAVSRSVKVIGVFMGNNTIGLESGMSGDAIFEGPKLTGSKLQAPTLQAPKLQGLKLEGLK